MCLPEHTVSKTGDKYMKNRKRKTIITVASITCVGAILGSAVLLLSTLNTPEKVSTDHSTVQTSITENHATLPKEFKPSRSGELPNFSVITDVKLKKKAFFEFLYPMVESENTRILELRNKIITLKNKSSLSESDEKYILEIAKKYKVTGIVDFESAIFDTLLTRIDVVPPSLTLAQAANESAWGTSRFARLANNLFGQWCFSKGCGVVPKSRDSGKQHEVAKFKSVQASVNAYIHNLNSGGAYKELRQIRKRLRNDNQTITGDHLANGLLKYSERGLEYVKEVQSMIRINKLKSYDTKLDLAVR